MIYSASVVLKTAAAEIKTCVHCDWILRGYILIIYIIKQERRFSREHIDVSSGSLVALQSLLVAKHDLVDNLQKQKLLDHQHSAHAQRRQGAQGLPQMVKYKTANMVSRM